MYLLCSASKPSYLPQDLRKRAAVMTNHNAILQYRHIIMYIMCKSCNQSRGKPKEKLILSTSRGILLPAPHPERIYTTAGRRTGGEAAPCLGCSQQE